MELIAAVVCLNASSTDWAGPFGGGGACLACFSTAKIVAKSAIVRGGASSGSTKNMRCLTSLSFVESTPARPRHTIAICSLSMSIQSVSRSSGTS